MVFLSFRMYFFSCLDWALGLFDTLKPMAPTFLNLHGLCTLHRWIISDWSFCNIKAIQYCLTSNHKRSSDTIRAYYLMESRPCWELRFTVMQNSSCSIKKSWSTFILTEENSHCFFLLRVTQRIFPECLLIRQIPMRLYVTRWPLKC